MSDFPLKRSLVKAPQIAILSSIDKTICVHLVVILAVSKISINHALKTTVFRVFIIGFPSVRNTGIRYSLDLLLRI